MQLELALLIGVLFAVATFLILQAGVVRILFGFVLISNAANLLLISMSGSPSGKSPPVVGQQPGVPMVDPLPQALILTAIVISFGVTAYFVFLLYRLFLEFRTTNAREIYKEPGEPSEVKK